MVKPEFRAYLGSTAFSGLAFAIQYLLLSRLLIGVLLFLAGTLFTNVWQYRSPTVAALAGAG